MFAYGTGTDIVLGLEIWKPDWIDTNVKPQLKRVGHRKQRKKNVGFMYVCVYVYIRWFCLGLKWWGGWIESEGN